MIVLKNALINKKKTNIIIDKGIIKKIGDKKKIEKNSLVIDLKNKLVLPGLVDTHLHTLALCKGNCTTLELETNEDEESIKEKIKKHLHDNDEKWIIVQKYCGDINGTNFLTKSFLDEIKTDKNIILVRECGHIGVINSNTIKELDLKENEYINLDTGVAKDNGLWQIIYNDKIFSQLKEQYREILNKYVEAGLTSVATNDFGFGVSNDLLFDTMIQLEKEKQLPLNMYHQVKVNSLKDAKESLKYFKKKTGMVRFLSYKIISDGSLGASTASMIEPYLNQGDNCGQMLIMKEEIIKIVNFANKHNIKVAIHVIGDNSLKTVLRAFKEAKKTKVKNQLIHCSLLYKGAAKLIKKLKLQVSYQPYFVNSDINFIKERLDGKRLEYWQNCATLIKNKILVCGSSDSPVCDFNPFTGIEASCNRSVFKEQNISLKQAIKMYSENAAKFLLNDKIGKIKKGMNADLIVLDKDIYRIKKDEIKTIKPLLVIVNGKIVYNNLGLLK